VNGAQAEAVSINSGDKKEMLGFGGSKIARANDNKEQAAEAPSMFETFEPRILMNGSFAGRPPSRLDAHPEDLQEMRERFAQLCGCSPFDDVSVTPGSRTWTDKKASQTN
jgi:hypothetical protein